MRPRADTEKNAAGDQQTRGDNKEKLRRAGINGNNRRRTTKGGIDIKVKWLPKGEKAAPRRVPRGYKFS